LSLQAIKLTDCPIMGKKQEVGEIELLRSFKKARKVKKYEHEFVRLYAHVDYLSILFNPKKEKIAVLTKRGRRILELCKI
jgi:hypothetical protein